jgi:hypothetical protein
MEDTMNLLVSTLANGTVQVWQATAIAGVALATCFIARGKPSAKSERLDGHTLTDIGIERGTITWMR